MNILISKNEEKMVKLISKNGIYFDVPKDKLIKHCNYFDKYYSLQNTSPDTITEYYDFNFEYSEQTIKNICDFINNNEKMHTIEITEELEEFLDYIVYKGDNFKHEIWCMRNIYPLIPIFIEYYKEQKDNMNEEIYDKIERSWNNYYAFISVDDLDEKKIYKLWKYNKFRSLTKEKLFRKYVMTAYGLIWYIKRFDKLFYSNNLLMFFENINKNPQVGFDILSYISKWLLNEVSDDVLCEKIRNL